MLSATRCRLLFYFLTGLVVVFLSGCDKPDKPINLVLGQNDKIALYPTPGQHLVWLNGIQVQFLGDSPCTETAQWLTECHVKDNSDSGARLQFFYICKDYACTDPELDVGPGNGGPRELKPKATKPSDWVGMGCKAGAITLAPPDLPDGSQNAPIKPGFATSWVATGGITNWLVTFNTPGVCDEPTVQSGVNTKCTIKQGLAPGKYTYTASSPDCATSAAGSLTTVAP